MIWGSYRETETIVSELLMDPDSNPNRITPEIPDTLTASRDGLLAQEDWLGHRFLGRLEDRLRR